MKSIKMLVVFTFLYNLASAQTIFEWARHLGSTGSDAATVMKLDSANNMYVAGQFSGTVNFDLGAGIQTLTAKGNIDIFIAKYDSSGNFIWVSQIGGDSNESVFMMQLDDSNNVYVTGTFIDTVDFDPGISVYNLESSVNNGFALKLDKNGNFLWAQQLGVIDWSYFSLDENSNAYIVGSFHGTVDFDPGIGVYNLTSVGSADMFILKLNPNGDFVWVKQMGSSTNALALSNLYTLGCIYVTGYFTDTVDFDPGTSIYNLYPQNGHTFLLRLDTNGNFIWAKNYGRNIGLGTAYGLTLAIDNKKNIYMEGYYSGTIDVDPGVGVYTLTSTGQFDIFSLKLDSIGDLIWAKSMGGKQDDSPGLPSVDSKGNVYITGEFRDTMDVDPGIGVYNLICHSTFPGDHIIFISKLDSSGNFLWAQQVGSDNNVLGGLVLDKAENMYIYGLFNSTCDFDLGAGVYNLTSYGDYDAFILKMRPWPLSTQDIIDKNEISIYPNPTYGISNLKFVAKESGKYRVVIYSIDGKIIKRIEGSYNQGINKIGVDLSNSPPNLYFVDTYLNQQKVHSFKLLKN